jgi:Fe-S-cluster-containing dehydrogenase component
MSKCDLCIERVTHGLEPACVPLGFGSMKELAESKAQKASVRILESLSGDTSL